MIYHLLNIFYAAFFTLGVYFAFEMILKGFQKQNIPKSITIILEESEKETNRNIRFLKNNLVNHNIILISEKESDENKDIKIIKKENLHKFILNELFTNT